MQRIAIIGGGLAGTVLARHLGSRARVEIFEKSRGPSGRLATRRCDGFEFDHGAQFFTARDARFQLFLRPHLESGLVQEWTPRLMTLVRGGKPYKRDWFEPHYVAVPGMNALVKELATGLTIHAGREIAKVGRPGSEWWLRDKNETYHGPFDWVVSTCPAAQTHALFPGAFGTALEEVKLKACFALMLGFKIRPKTKWQAAQFKDSLLDWATWSDSKPGRSGQPSLVVLSNNDWAEEHLPDSLDHVRDVMQRELLELSGIDAGTAEVAQIHRWRYANATQPAEQSFLLDPAHQLAACGDWCLANRVEAAFLSAARLANRLNQLIPHE